ncbi:unnamed protein product [Closterium sp. NIES-54]
MASHGLVSGLPRVFPLLPPSLAPPCTPCVAGRLRTTLHSSSLRPATAPFLTLHLDVWGPAPTHRTQRERYFLVVVDDYSRHTMVFPLAKKSKVTSTLIRWILATGGTRGSRFCCLHSDRVSEYRSGILAGFCGKQGISVLDAAGVPQQNGVAEHRIGLVMDIARTSMIHARAPHFLWPYAVRYAVDQLNLQPRVLRPEASPTRLWTRSPVTVDSGGVGAGGTVIGGTRSRGARLRGVGARGAGTGSASSRGVGAGGAGASGASSGGAGAGGTGTGDASFGGAGAGGAGTGGAISGGTGARGTGAGGASFGGAGAGGAGAVGASTEETGAGGMTTSAPTAPPHRYDTRLQALCGLEREEQERLKQERQELQQLDQQQE